MNNKPELIYKTLLGNEDYKKMLKNKAEKNSHYALWLIT